MGEHNKKGAGGKRSGAGRPAKGETTTINFRIDAGKKKDLKTKYPNKLNGMFCAWVEGILL